MRTGDVLGQYRLVAELGSGGMGTVWSAVGRQGPVAVKIVHPHLLATPELLERFRREAEIGRTVRHENVVAALDGGSATGGFGSVIWLAMELCEGRTLRALLAELTRVPEELCRHIGREIAKGLVAIHAAGAVHRDLKPDNVLITRDNTVKVMDLGVARLTGDVTQLSQPGTFVGSWNYAAPEQFGGAVFDHRLDLHALGLVLYELSTGGHPFPDTEVPRLMQRVLHERPRRPSETTPQLSPFFEEFVLHLLEKDPARRFASAAEVVSVLGAGEDSPWWQALVPSIRSVTRRPPRRVRVVRETALVGRETELAKLAAVWDAARSGEGGVLVVDGEPGIGKSRLIDEFVALRREAGEDPAFLHGSYPPSGAATAYGAFTTALSEHLGAECLDEALRLYLRETPLLVPAFAAHLRGGTTPPGAEPLTRDSLQTVFVHLMRALAAERATVLLIDDLDFAPDEGRALFAALAVAVAGHRLLLVGTTQRGAGERWLSELERRITTTRLTLGRLGAKDLSRLLVDAFRSERLAEELAFQIAAKSDGNPFFVFEILRGLREDRFIERRGDGTWISTRAIREIEIPSSVQELVRARIEALGADDRSLLDVAACCGADFDPLLVAAALGLSRMAVLQRLAWIEKTHRLVRSSGRRYVFDHNQVREVLHGGLTELLREEYHLAIAVALVARLDGRPAGGAESSGIATHLLRGGRALDAAQYLRAAVEHLQATNSHEAAAELARLSLAAADAVSGAARVDLLLRHASSLSILGRRDDERVALDEAVALADASGDPILRSRASRSFGWHLGLVGRPREATPLLEQAIELARVAGNASLRRSAHGSLGSVLWSTGRYAEARAHIEHQIESARAAGDEREESTAWGNLGLVEYALGRYDEALSCHRRHLDLARAAGDRRGAAMAMGNVGIVFTSLGRWSEAREHIEAQLLAAREIGDRRSEAIALGNLANVRYALGLWADCRSALERAVALSRETGLRANEAAALVNLGPLVAELGDLERAEDALDAALSIARATGARYEEGYAHFEQGELADMEDDGRRAASLHERALVLRREIGHRDGVAESLVALGRIRAAAGETAAARAHLDEAASLAAELGLVGFAALAAVYRAGLPGGDVAAALALVAANEPRMMLRDRMEARFLLGRVTGDASHLAEARRILGELVANAPAESREPMVSGVPLHRRVAGSDADGGPTGA